MRPPTIGDLNPEIARKFGLESDQGEMLSQEIKRWEGRIQLVTFTAPPHRADGKSDPIAYLPPEFTTYGIVDRDHRSRVNLGETWLVEAVEKITGTPFLIPLIRLDLKNFLDLQPERLQALASYIAVKNPILAQQLAEKLPTPPKPRSSEELESLRKETQRLQTSLGQLAKEKASLETELGQLRTQRPDAAAPDPLSSSHRAPPSTRPQLEIGPPSPATTDREPLQLPQEGALLRGAGETVESPLLVHPAYEIHFTGDLYRVLLRPSSRGVPCEHGKLVVRGLSRVDPKPAPTDYQMIWDARAGGFVAYIGNR